MGPRYYFAAIVVVGLFVAILVLTASNSLPPSAVAQETPTSEVRDAVEERVDVHVEAGIPLSATIETTASPVAPLQDGPSVTEPAASQVTPLQDGPSLLETHCAQCHSAQLLERIKKPRAKWEETLTRMEKMGAQLNGGEKATLLDYLAATD